MSAGEKVRCPSFLLLLGSARLWMRLHRPSWSPLLRSFPSLPLPLSPTALSGADERSQIQM